MNHHIAARQHLAQQPFIENIAFVKGKPRAIPKRCQMAAMERSGIQCFVEVVDTSEGVTEVKQTRSELGTDKSGTTRNYDAHGRI